MKNIYEDLEIKDYGDTNDLVKDIIIRFDLLEEFDSISVFGNNDFVLDLLFRLMSLNMGFKAYSVEWDGKHYHNNADYYLLDIDAKKRIYIEPVYNFRNINGTNQYTLKCMSFGGDDYVRCFLNQDNVNQEIVDYCLNNFQEVMLFGIGYE